MIIEMGIPVLGREEDAADALATIVAVKMSDAFSDRVVTNAARGWFLGDQRDRKEGIPTTYYDEHGMDLQRAYNIVCLMVGGQPEKFEGLANEVKLPAQRQASCQDDFSNASWSWDKVLAPHKRKPDDPKTKIEGPKFEGTIRRGSATCPCCGYTTPVARIREQLRTTQGGIKAARLLCVSTAPFASPVVPEV